MVFTYYQEYWVKFVIDIFDIYLNNICHIVFSLYLVRTCLGGN